MQFFADIALSTLSSSVFDNSTKKRTLDEPATLAPPSKRAKSEKLPSPEMSVKHAVVNARPVTSYQHNSQANVSDAELLLNFSQIARRSSFQEEKMYNPDHPRRSSPQLFYQQVRHASQGDIRAHSPRLDPYTPTESKPKGAALLISERPEQDLGAQSILSNGKTGHAQRNSKTHAKNTSKNGTSENKKTNKKAPVHVTHDSQTRSLASMFLLDAFDGNPADSPNEAPVVVPESVYEAKSRNDPIAICAACKFARNSLNMDGEYNATSWISCDACKDWFHFACAGFKTEREVRSVDKYRCKKCKPIHGATTYVRKSSRAHSAIDYAGLHQGVLKTSDERMEHHYIQPIKDGIITFLPESFARMRPELVTAEFFEKSGGMKEPVVIPAELNPQPRSLFDESERTVENHPDEDIMPDEADNQFVADEGQDALDMIIPAGLTVRRVAELYGPEEKVEVIDVKSQNGENKKWNMRRWADYYENPSNKVVRNVISLEVSQSRLGRLIRRPKIVRDLDLQDSVWPEDLLAKGEFPRVQFYCLMSVADCFTDFHIDFGGSSVFYHIIKGKKTFLFIPPKEKHLKKYEEWCMSPAQNWTFLADQTKECYRVDLSEGDTMLIPSGWIHAVWTPEDSLVIGGNFLTRMNFGMQLRVAQVEKATGVARKFRYPHFQKIHWYTTMQYLEEDPLPENVKELLNNGESFSRETPTYFEFDSWGENSRTGRENYHVRYYSQSELDGLPELARYLLRTALIDIGTITDGITAEMRNAVKKSIPRGHGEPLDIVKAFAAWCAWKRGNEPLPHWAYPDAQPESLAPDKLSAAAMRKLDREAAHEAALQAPRRQSRRVSQKQASPAPKVDESNAPEANQPISEQVISDTPTDTRIVSGSNRKTACETCRKRRRACKHKDQGPVAASDIPGKVDMENNEPTEASKSTATVDQNTSQPSGPGSILNENLTPSNDTGKNSDNTESSIHTGTPSSRPRTKACNECRKSKVSMLLVAKFRVLIVPSDDAFMTLLVTKILSRWPSKPFHAHTPGKTANPTMLPLNFLTPASINCS